MDVVDERLTSENKSRFLSVMIDWAKQSQVSKSEVTVVTLELGHKIVRMQKCGLRSLKRW